MKIYLDINETIIYRTHQSGKSQVKYADYFKEFLHNALQKHNVYWLSTMCQGDSDGAVAYLSPFLPPDILELASRVEPTRWGQFKVDAINLDDDFLWFDDVLLPKEEEILRKAGKLDSFIRVDHHKNSEFFKDWINI